MRALRPGKGAVPRAFKDSRRTIARRYREYCLAIQEQWGPLPAVALPTLREAGLLFLELERIAADMEAARARRRRRDIARLGRRQFACREQLMRLERRLQELGGTRTPSLAEQLAARPASTTEGR